MSILIETAYMPPVDYMKEVIMADSIVIEAFETYTKQTCRNHCTMYGPNGKQTLAIPVIKVNGNHTLTRDIRISDHQPWQRTHWRSIETAYNNSPFFLFYQDLFAPYYERRFNFLIDLNLELLHLFLRIMKLNRIIRTSVEYVKSPSGIRDLRGILVQKRTEQAGQHPHYIQVFESSHGFIPGLSVLDVIFNLGPESKDYICS
jgi:hypothetical protein